MTLMRTYCLISSAQGKAPHCCLAGKGRQLAVERQIMEFGHLYKLPPTEVVSLQDFEEFAEKRLRLLQAVERKREKLSQEGVHRNSKDYFTQMKTVVKGSDTVPFAVALVEPDKMSPEQVREFKKQCKKQQEDRRRDHISHYILRLAYCRTEDMRRWFLSQETELLRCRYMVLCHPKDRREFLDHHKSDFNFKHEEMSDIHDNIWQEICSFYSITDVASCIKVPFTAALDLVQSRQVVLKNGYVYVPEGKDDMILSLVCNKFRARVSEELVKTLHHLAVVDDDERIAPFLKGLKDRYLGVDFSAGTEFSGQVHPSQIDGLNKESFPPCMRHLHETLRSEHHLRHFGRLQYGLFLKSIGLALEDAIAFWRAEFTRKMDPDKFDKQYAYNVRHSYGKEGKRANYTPYSCMKIIMSNTPTQGDHHGCPFRHWDRAHLTQLLQSHGLSSKDCRSVTGFVEKSHYQLACQKYFEITHKLQSAPFSLEHPTQYFSESRLVRGGGVGDQKPETGGMESGQNTSGMESGHNGGIEPGNDSAAMDVTAEISMKDMEDFDDF